MPKLNWDGNDFNNSQDSSGTTADNISHNGNLQQGYKHGSLTEGLVAYYPMEKGEGEVLHDGALDNLGQIKPGSSGSNTSVSDMWDSASQVGYNNLELDGEDDYINIGRLPIKSFTIAFYFYPRDNTTRQSIINNYGGTNSEQHYKVDISGDGNLELFIDDGSTGETFIGQAISLDEYSFIAVSYNYDTNEVRIYQNESIITSATYSGDSPNLRQRNTFLGKRRVSDIEHFNGKLDDVRIYDRQLSVPEMKGLENLSRPSGVEKTENSVPGQKEGGISYYKLNGNTDDAWNNNPGTNNGVTFETGVHGQAGRFNHDENDWIEINDVVDNFAGTEKYTWSAWIKTTLNNNGMIVATNSENGNRGLLRVRGDQNGNIEFYMNETDSIITGPIVNDGKWHQVTLTTAPDYTRLYVDMKEVDSIQESQPHISDDRMSIGQEFDGQTISNFFDGKIDDVRIYDKALTAVQVEKLYHKGAYRISRESTLQ